MAQVIKKILFRTFLFIPAALLVLAIALLAALQMPSVQTSLARFAARELSQAIQFPISIDYVAIKWFDKAVFRGIHIDDRASNRMIDVPQLTVDFELSSLLKRDIVVDQAILSDAQVRLIINNVDSTLNIDEFIIAIQDLTSSGDTTRSLHPPVFTISEVKLENVAFSLDDQRNDTITEGFDYYHIALDQINADARNFRVVSDTIEIQVDQLTAKEPKTRLDVNELRTFFRYTRHSMLMDDLYARIGNSIIRDQVEFRYQHPSDLGRFNTGVTMVGHLTECKITSEDLSLFAPDLRDFTDLWTVSGDFNGKVVRFRMRDADLQFGEKSRVRGDISFDGLPSFRETFIDLELAPSELHPGDLRQYIGDEASYAVVRKFGRVGLKGNFLGFPNDFVANGSFTTALGGIVSDINLKINQKNQALSTYSGKLVTSNFDLGRLFDEPLLQKLDMNGQVKGRGFSIKDASVDLKASIRRIGVNKYDYRNIKVDGRLSRSQFEGNLAVQDTNLVINARGKLDLRNNVNIINVQADLQRAYLKELNLSADDAFVRTKLDVDVRGLKIDNIVGRATFRDSYIVYNNRDIILDSLHVSSFKGENHTRDFQLDSDLVSASIQGNFEFTRAFADLNRLVEEYRINFVNNEAAAESYYRKKSATIPSQQYRIEYDFRLKDINPLLHLFEPSLYVSAGTHLNGNFSNGFTSILSLNTHIDSVFYKDYRIYDTEIDINTSKLADSTDVLAAGYIASARQYFGSTLNTESLAVEAIWNGDRIEFTSALKETGSTNTANLNGHIQFLAGSTQIHFTPSRFRVLDDVWQIANENLITIQGQEITFKTLQLSNRYQMISLNGTLSEAPEKAAELRIRDFNLRTLNPIVGKELQGTANGFVVLKDFYRDKNFEGELEVDELVIDNFLIGNITGQAHWDTNARLIRLESEIYRMHTPVVSLAGTFDPNAEADALNIVARLRRTDLVILEPFFRSEVSNLGGQASGTLRIGGTFASPLLKGTLTVANGRFRYNYLNTTYQFNDKVYFGENEIVVRQLQLTDDDNNVAIVQGGVFHDGFKNFVIDLQASMRTFKVLNTSAKDNSMFYGTAFATGDLSILGSISNLVVQAKARTNRGTKIFIPFDDYVQGIEQQEYIRFVSRHSGTDSTAATAIQRVDLTGVKLDFDFDITSDAEVALIFDLRAGDIMRGTGNGKIKMQIDTEGDFTMFGDYVIEKGVYNFTLLNAINKEFRIQSGSRVSWFGDPYAGVLDVKASYDQTTSLLPIMNTNSQDQSKTGEYTRRYPVAVLLNLTGNVMSPDIKLGIQFKEYPQNIPDLRNAVLEFESRIATDEQELNRQVFSLMVLRRFSPEGSFSGIQGGVGNSVSELLSNQLSYWASQVDQNLEVNLDLNGLDEEAFNNMQVRLSYSLMDGRLRLTRDGNFNTEYQSSTQSIIGEWTLEYVLTQDGKLRIKMYNRNTQNVLNTINNTANSVAGFSIMHTQTFNNVKEVFSRKKKKRGTIVLPGEDATPAEITTSDSTAVRKQ
jgi:hypothetical protein